VVKAASLESIWRDVRYALRGLRNRPAFTVVAVSTLALGIGVNAASLAVAYGILLRPLPYLQPSRVVILNLLSRDGGDLGFSPRALQAWLPRVQTMATAGGYYRREVTVRSGGTSTVVPAAVVTDGFFEALGTPAEAGRRPLTNSPDVIVSRRVLRALVRTEDVSGGVGAPLLVSDTPRVLAGIFPAEFAFPDEEVGLWLPSALLTPETGGESAGYSKIVARLMPRVSVDQFRDEANRIRRELNPTSGEIVSVAVLGESIVAGMRSVLLVVVVGALLVLAVACANVATLFIGRNVSRDREFASRMALGASRGQLVRSFLIEASLVALIASVLGMGLAIATLTVFLSQAAGVVSGLQRVVIGVPMVLAIVGLIVLTTLCCGVIPAWHAARTDHSPFLHATIGARPRAWRLRRTLVIAQIALACVLLVGAGLLSRTVSVLMREDHGFDANGTLEAKFVLSDRVLIDGDTGGPFVQALLERVRRLDGVVYAGFGSNLPPYPPSISIAIRLKRDNGDETRFVSVGSATPGYLRALGTRFTAGRDFEERDHQAGAPVVILSESVARFYFGDQDPIGRTIARLPAMLGTTAPPRVIGVVRDIKYDGLDSPAGSAIYVPWAQRPLGKGYLIVRADRDPVVFASAIRAAAHDLDPTVPMPELRSLEDALAHSLANRRIRALPAIGFGALALAIAFVGVLATLLTLVAERRRDLAIRAAVGAAPTDLLWIIMREGVVLTLIGLLIGLAVAGGAGRALSSLLYHVGPLDAATFSATTLLIGGGALLTTYLAAIRARRIDPVLLRGSE
jgi:putative ABC transport system permease protein